MAQLFFNNGRARLAAAISASQTTLQLRDRVNLPNTLATGDWFLLTIARQDSRYGSNVEVVRVTAVSGDNVTVQRAYEGAAVPHGISEVVECRTTADTYARMLQEAVWTHVGGKPATATRWPTWGEVTGKPNTFTPSSHTHPWTQITGAPAQATRWPSWAEVEGKPTNFPPVTHSHDWSQVANAPATATRWPSWVEVTGKPSTTDSRTSASATILLQAKAMNDHRNSDDHDARYHTKAEADGRFLRLANGGEVAGDIAIKKTTTSAATTALHGRQTTEAVVSRVTMANDAETSTPGVLEAWRRAAGSLDLELSGFRQILLNMGLITTAGFTSQNAGYNALDLYTQRTTGNVGGIRFYSAGVNKGELNFGVNGSITAAAGSYFAGNGQGLINLPASAIASGVIPTDRLPTTDSRTSTSQTQITTAKAMNDHRLSGDHDERYYIKSQIDTSLGLKLDASAYTAADVRAKLLTVGGAGSGVDADLLDGKHATEFAAASHTHPWAQVTGQPATATRWPSFTEVTGKPATYEPSAHNHDAGNITSGVLNKARIPVLDHADVSFANQHLNTNSSVTHKDVTLPGNGFIRLGDFAIQYNAATQSLDFNFVGN